MKEHFFITGALGCLGAWVVRNLVQEGFETTIYDLGSEPHRLRLIMSDEELARVHFVAGGDVTNLDMVDRALRESSATHVIHLAALQVPFCKADPPKGALVNVVGTTNIFEAAKRAGLKRVVYASSIAVYGPSEDYPEGLLQHDAEPRPRSHYGVYKQANEGTARIYWMDDGVSSIGLRPYTVYGPGRDQGLTSSPTKAMLAAALGKPYHIPFGGVVAYHLADDVAKIFIQAARVKFDGAEVFNLKGTIAAMPEVIGAIEAAAPDVRGKITFEDKSLPFPTGADDRPLVNAIGPVPETPLREGVSWTVEQFRQALASGRLAGEVPA